MAKKTVKSRDSGGYESLRLFDFKTRHQPVKLLPGDRFYLGFVPRPPVSALDYIQSLIEKNLSKNSSNFYYQNRIIIRDNLLKSPKIRFPEEIFSNNDILLASF